MLRRLPAHRLEACSTLPQVKVTSGSTISVKEKLYAKTLGVWYALR